MLQAIGNFFQLGNSFEDQSTGEQLGTLVALPFRLIWGFLVFMVFGWTASRNGRAFMFAIPAMLFIVFCVALVWVANNKAAEKAKGVSKAYYYLSVEEASPFYDLDAALLYAKKVVSEEPESSYGKYELGLSYDRIEEYDRAHEVMKWLSEESQAAAINDDEVVSDKQWKGYSEAHLWLAGYYSNTKKSELDENLRQEKSDQQVRLAYKADPTNVFAVLAMAGIHRRIAEEHQAEADKFREEGSSGQAAERDKMAFTSTRESVKFFNEAIDLPLKTERQLYASIALIEILQEENRDEEARLSGMRFIAKHQKNARDFPNVLPFWVSIVKTCMLLEDYDRGENYILQGYQLAQDPEVRQTLAQLAAQIEVERAKSLEDMDDEEQFIDKLYALATAIKTDVRVPEGYSELLYYVDGYDMESEQDLWLRDSVLGGSSKADDANFNLDPRVPGVIHIILGLRDIVNGNVNDGQKHWEISGQQFQLAPFAINYFIQVFAEKRELNNEKRNELISIAIEMFPQSPHFYATRGRFLMENKKHSEAIEDLKFASARIPDSKTILGNLVECYETLGDSEKANKYQKKIDKLIAAEQVDRISSGFSSEQPENEKDKDKE